MIPVRRQMHLAAMLNSAGLHGGGWRLPQAEIGPVSLDLQVRLARLAEQAKFDMVFYADNLHTKPSSTPGAMVKLEPLTLLAALSVATTRIGLSATASTTYSVPFQLARMFGSIDHLSGGRAGWNIVTSSDAEIAANFGLPAHPDKDERYEMAAEFVEVVKGLWDSWEDDAVVLDKKSGVVADFAKAHALDHHGKFYSVAGPLNMPRPPQGYPVLIQAGGSEAGMAFAASVAEVVFTVQADIPTTKKFGDRLRQMMQGIGRDPAHLRILPGLCPIIAPTKKEAEEMLWEMGTYSNPDAAWETLGSRLGYKDLKSLPPEGPVPDIPEADRRGHAIALLEVARKHNFNLRQLRDYAAAAVGHHLVLGPPEAIADEMEEWFSSGAADGFVVAPSYLPGALEKFCAEVVPILQQRGLFRTEYTGQTLREHLHLPRPPHTHSAPQRQSA